MNWARRCGLAILVLASLPAAPATAGWGPEPAAEARYPSRPDGPVYDGANIIPEADERRVDERLREYHARTGRALVVATTPNLGGETIETYAATLLNGEWSFGGVEIDPSVLVLVAPNERQMRIEVGHGLRRRVPDDLVDGIIRDEFTPRFRNGDYAGGIETGLAALVAQLDTRSADSASGAETAAAAENDEPGPWGWRERSWGDWANIIAWFVWFAFMCWLLPKVRRYLLGEVH